MISIVRKNLRPSLISSPNFSFLCNPNLLSIHHFSTSKSKLRRRLKKTPSPGIYDVLYRKHHFSFEFASSMASAELTKSSTPERADSVLSFLKDNSFTNAQLEKIVRYDPGILGYNVEGLQLKLSVFRDLGLSSEEVAKMMVGNTNILHSSVPNRIVPSLSILKGLLGSNDEVARLLRKCGRFITSDLRMRLMPNIEIMKGSGIPMKRVLRHFLFLSPRTFLIKPDVMKKSVDKAIKFGVTRTSTSFIHAVSVFAHTTQGLWEAKLQTLRDLGFSDDEILSMFRNQPMVFAQSGKKIESVVELLVGTGKYNIPDIVKHPASLGYSIEKRLEPRLKIMGLLESKDLIERRPCLAVLCQYNDGRFSDQFVKLYLTNSTTADSVLSFLKDNSFTNAQLEKIVRYTPKILGYNVEGLQLKLSVFRDLGLSSEEVAKMMVTNTTILQLSVPNNIMPNLCILKGLLGSDQAVATLLRKSAWFLKSSDLNNTLLPNIEILKSSGLPMERVVHFLHLFPRLLLIKPDIMKKSVEKAIEFGVTRTSTSFIHAVRVFAHTTQGLWEAKLQTLRDLGFSDDEILSMFRNQPMVFAQTGKKMESVVELLVGTGKYNIPDIVKHPASLGYSIEKRLEPRLKIMGLLESKNLIERWPSLAILCRYNDAWFSDQFVKPNLTKSTRADSVLSFLKDNSFTNAQLEKIVRYKPLILGHNVEGLQLKLSVFRDLGLSSEEVAKMMVGNTNILHSSVPNRIVPSLSILKELLGSNDEVARLLRRSGWFVGKDMNKNLMPNVQILKSSGIPMERVRHFLFVSTRTLFIKPDVMRRSVDKAIQFGVSRNSIAFIVAVTIFSYMSQEMLEVKLQFFRDLGFSDAEVLIMIRRQPTILSISQQKLKNVVELLVGTGKYNSSNIVSTPASLGCSVKKRLEPRLQILGLVESRNLIEKWPCLSSVCSLTDARFYDQYVRPYREEVGEAFDNMSYVSGKIN